MGTADDYLEKKEHFLFLNIYHIIYSCVKQLFKLWIFLRVYSRKTAFLPKSFAFKKSNIWYTTLSR